MDDGGPCRNWSGIITDLQNVINELESQLTSERARLAAARESSAQSERRLTEAQTHASVVAVALELQEQTIENLKQQISQQKWSAEYALPTAISQLTQLCSSVLGENSICETTSRKIGQITAACRRISRKLDELAVRVENAKIKISGLKNRQAEKEIAIEPLRTRMLGAESAQSFAEQQLAETRAALASILTERRERDAFRLSIALREAQDAEKEATDMERTLRSTLAQYWHLIESNEQLRRQLARDEDAANPTPEPQAPPQEDTTSYEGLRAQLEAIGFL